MKFRMIGTSFGHLVAVLGCKSYVACRRAGPQPILLGGVRGCAVLPGLCAAAGRGRSLFNQSRIGTGVRLGIAQIEQVIDPDCRRLNAGIFSREDVPRKEGKRCWNDNGLVAQANIIVLKPNGPIVCKGPFKAAARQPTGIGTTVGKSGRCVRREIGEGYIVATNPSPTAFDIKQNAVECITGASGYGRYPSVVAAELERLGTRGADRSEDNDVVDVVARSPVKVRFEANDKLLNLVISPNLSAAEEYRVVWITPAEAKQAVVPGALRPSPTNVAA